MFRRSRAPGERLRAVVFEASRELHIQRVVQLLGNGLDENVWAAAPRIQSRPGDRDGQVYDRAALVHSMFELSE
jgi:hypothetical protein